MPSTTTLLVFAVAAIALIVAAWATLYAGRRWRSLSHAAGADRGDPASRDQFIAVVGTFSSALFTLGIAMQWFTQFVLSPCSA